MITTIKKDFPMFLRNPGLVYLDSAATSLKPDSVIQKLNEYYRDYSANVFRGIYRISEKATDEYERSRTAIASFINAKKPEELVFVRNATEGFNLVAYALGRKLVSEGDEVVTTVMEHHSNFIPWQQLAFENGATFKVVDITNDGQLNLTPKTLDMVITKKTKILALTYVSNVLSTINPVKEIVRAAKKIHPKLIVVVDAAQAIPHMKVDVQDIGCDFLAFSSHKMLGPTGVGALWGRYELMREMFPFLYGGEMISDVAIERTVFADPPHKFEAGTPDIGGAIAWGEAVSYLTKVGLERIRAHEKELVTFARQKLSEAFGSRITILGPDDANLRAGVIAFRFSRFHPHDVAQILDEDSICVRAGHHCAMPLHKRLGLSSSCRVSFYLYNTKEDVDKLLKGLQKVEKILK